MVSVVSCIVLVIDCPAFQAHFFLFKLSSSVVQLLSCVRLFVTSWTGTSDLWLVWIDYLLLAHELDIEGWPKINSSKSACMFCLLPSIYSPFRHSPSWLTFLLLLFLARFFVVSKLGFAIKQSLPLWLHNVCRHFFMWHFSVLLPEGFPHWRAVPLADLRDHFSAYGTCLHISQPLSNVSLLFFSSLPFPSPSVVYFCLWSDIEGEWSAQLRRSAPDLSQLQLFVVLWSP